MYNTQGGITDEEELRSLEPLWTITAEYAKQLEIIAKRFRVSVAECIIVDQSFRVKRARGTTNFNGTSVVWYQTMEYQEDHLFGSWFDITLTNDVPDITLTNDVPDIDLKAARTAECTHLKKEL